MEYSLRQRLQNPKLKLMEASVWHPFWGVFYRVAVEIGIYLYMPAANGAPGKLCFRNNHPRSSLTYTHGPTSYNFIGRICSRSGNLCAWKTHLRLSRPLFPPGPKSKPIIGNLFDLPTGGNEWVSYRRLSRESRSDIVYLNVLGNSILALNSYQAALYSSRPLLPMLKELEPEHDSLLFKSLLSPSTGAGAGILSLYRMKNLSWHTSELCNNASSPTTSFKRISAS